MKTLIRALSVITVLFAMGFFMGFYMSFVLSPATAPIAAPTAVPQQPVIEPPSPAVQAEPVEDPLTVASKAAISAANDAGQSGCLGSSRPMWNPLSVPIPA
jgi:hypothetical protein